MYFQGKKKGGFCFFHVWLCLLPCLNVWTSTTVSAGKPRISSGEPRILKLIYRKKKKFSLFPFSDEILVFHSFATLSLLNILCWDDFGSERKWVAGGALREQRMVGVIFNCCFSLLDISSHKLCKASCPLCLVSWVFQLDFVCLACLLLILHGSPSKSFGFKKFSFLSTFLCLQPGSAGFRWLTLLCFTWLKLMWFGSVTKPLAESN